MSDQQIAELFNWKKTYDNGPYTFLGYLEGAFYDKEGNKKAVLLEAEKKREIFKEACGFDNFDSFDSKIVIFIFVFFIL